MSRYIEMHHPPNPRQRAIAVAMKTMWMFLRPIELPSSQVDAIEGRHERQEEQHQEERDGESEHDEDHPLFGDQVHEEEKHERRLEAGDDERERDRFVHLE